MKFLIQSFLRRHPAALAVLMILFGISLWYISLSIYFNTQEFYIKPIIMGTIFGGIGIYSILPSNKE